jgi:hypothetical protein
MKVTGSLLSSQASFELAALFVTWIAVVFLLILVANLHARLRRLEHASAASRPVPYGHLLGRKVQDIVDTASISRLPRVLFFLSSNCSSCARLLSEIASPSWTVPSAIVWADDSPPEQPPPERTPVLGYGPKLSDELGIRVMPFALVADADGRVVKAGPVGSLSALGAVTVNGSSYASREPVLDHN